MCACSRVTIRSLIIQCIVVNCEFSICLCFLRAESDSEEASTDDSDSDESSDESSSDYSDSDEDSDSDDEQEQRIQEARVSGARLVSLWQRMGETEVYALSP